MEISTEHTGNISILRLEGEVDARNLPDASRAVDDLFASMRTRIVFNLSAVPIVTSSTIAFLIDVAKRAREHGGDAVLAKPTPLLRKSLKVLDLDRFFRIFDEDAAALSHFQDGDLDDTVDSGDWPPETKDWREKLKFWRKN